MLRENEICRDGKTADCAKGPFDAGKAGTGRLMKVKVTAKGLSNRGDRHSGFR
jgi:hypothetical protein